MNLIYVFVCKRMTLCEIYIREVGTTHPYLIQCVLRINLFNEIIFICVWYWLLFVICVTLLDLMRQLITLFLSCSSCNRKLFALKYLELVHLNVSLNQLSVKRFAAKLRAKKKINVDSLLEREKTAAAAAANIPGQTSSPRDRNQSQTTNSESRDNSIYYDNNMFLKVNDANNASQRSSNQNQHQHQHMNTLRPDSVCSSMMMEGESNYE